MGRPPAHRMTSRTMRRSHAYIVSQPRRKAGATFRISPRDAYAAAVVSTRRAVSSHFPFRTRKLGRVMAFFGSVWQEKERFTHPAKEEKHGSVISV